MQLACSASRWTHIENFCCYLLHRDIAQRVVLLLYESMSISTGSGETDFELQNACAVSFHIQYASDLHLEFGNRTAFQSIIKPVAKYLALAGDVGRPDQQSCRDFTASVSVEKSL